MANKFIRYLTGDSRGFFPDLVGGLIKPKGNVANWQHATRIFVDNTFRLAPRSKFLFYAVFEIDPLAHNSSTFTNRHSPEVGLLIKSADLPKYQFDIDTKNQYNRKKLTYKKINYQPVNLSFHDDNTGVINAMLALYYGAYVRDRNLPSSAHTETKFRPANSPFDSFQYGLDNNRTVDFFKSISIYTLSRSRFNGYTLVNPKIANWDHGDVSYADGDTLESTMSVQYEAVKYSSGNVSVGNPKGFATLHYDTAPSPLSIQGGGTASLFGEGGVLAGIESVFGDVASGSAFGSAGGFLSTAIKAVNTYRNIKNVDSNTIKREVKDILNSPAGVTGVINTVSGIAAAFPRNTPSTDQTPAVQRTLLANR